MMLVGNVLPGTPMYDIKNRFDSRTEHAAQRIVGAISCRIEFSDLAYFLCVKLGIPAIFTSAIASLVNHISDIVNVSPQEKMKWVAAISNIAGMADEHPIRNWSAKQLPRISMRQSSLTVYDKNSVTAFAITSCPKHVVMIVGQGYMRKEKLIVRLRRPGQARRMVFHASGTSLAPRTKATLVSLAVVEENQIIRKGNATFCTGAHRRYTDHRHGIPPLSLAPTVYISAGLLFCSNYTTKGRVTP
jgi:hypothetical protein